MQQDPEATTGVIFYLDGEERAVAAPDPTLMLIDYLRAPDVDKTGPKKPCGQGGCGGCTVILSEWCDDERRMVNRSINSCLRPVAALNGLSVTTIDGTGSVAGGMNPVAFEVARHNGTQCGYCTNGWVMNMSAFIAENPEGGTKKQIEDLFDGNICRCTGYRQLLDGLKEWATDLTNRDREKFLTPEIDPAFDPGSVRREIRLPVNPKAKEAPAASSFTVNEKVWFAPTSVDDLLEGFGELSRPIHVVHGNTSWGIYDEEIRAAVSFVDLRSLDELTTLEVVDDALLIGAGVTYSHVNDFLAHQKARAGETGGSVLSALSYMARRTAGLIVRNAATIGGNTMLVLKHIHLNEWNNSPFPSDFCTALTGMNAEVTYLLMSSGEYATSSLLELIERCVGEPEVVNDVLLIAFAVPLGDKEHVSLCQKVALREVNSHSVVNAGTQVRMVSDDNAPTIEAISLVLGGIAPYPIRMAATEEALTGRSMSPETMSIGLEALAAEISAILDRWSDRLTASPFDGFSNAYRIELAGSYLFRALINTQVAIAPESVPEDLRSMSDDNWGSWPESRGNQTVETVQYRAPLSQSYLKLMAFYQSQGETRYTQEAAVPTSTLNGAVVQCRRALADFYFTHPEGDEEIDAPSLEELLRQRYDEFQRLLTVHDVEAIGGTNLTGMAGDQPLFADGSVHFQGQVLALVLASGPDGERSAQDIARFVEDHCVGFRNAEVPVLSIEEAFDRGQIFPDCPASAPFIAHCWQVERPGSNMAWTTDSKPTDLTPVQRTDHVGATECSIVEGGQRTGDQIHFYMETQACIAIPQDDGSLLLHPSTQSPMAVQNTASTATGLPYNRIGVQIRQVGGGYGGKTEQSRLVAGLAAVASWVTQMPVRLALPRDVDTALVGRRHPYIGRYQIAVDKGTSPGSTKGAIRGVQMDMLGDGGQYYDCSFVVSDCVQGRIDNAYYTPNFRSTIDVVQTNKAANTAFRSFGDVQGMLMLECGMEDAAWSVDMDPADFRRANMYERGQSTPIGQMLEYCYIDEVFDFAREQSDYDRRRAEIEEFNKANRWTKRGISLIPMKYGMGYNLAMLEQSAAMVNVFSHDGSVMIRQGGVDMGQGMVTKLTQIAAYVLDVPLEIVQLKGSDTNVIPNPTSTGASTGTQYNGEAIRQACQDLRNRLMAYCYEQRENFGEAHCQANHLNFWDHPDGWKHRLADGSLVWDHIVSSAYNDRVNLQSQVNAQIPGGSDPVSNIRFKSFDEQPTGTGIAVDPDGAFSESVDAFAGFTYNAACSEVQVDILTGQMKILRSDIFYDMGLSLNPALDVGQVEGAFVQGVGYMTTEQAVFQPSGENVGNLNTPNTWGYKPPAITTIPLEMNTTLFPRELASSVPENPNTLFSSKEVGEPPLVLANTVFFALKSAIRASRCERGLSPYFKLDAPATVQAARGAAEISGGDLYG